MAIRHRLSETLGCVVRCLQLWLLMCLCSTVFHVVFLEPFVLLLRVLLTVLLQLPRAENIMVRVCQCCFLRTFPVGS